MQFLKTLLIVLAPHLLVVVACVAIILIITFLAKRKSDIEYAKSISDFIYVMLKEQYGDKADIIYENWKECLKHAEEDKWTRQEMIDHFLKLISATLLTKDIEAMSADDNLKLIQIMENTYNINKKRKINTKYLL
jgi:hypothetical protein